jgi:hypothetical protein
VKNATFRPRDFAETRSTSAVVDDLIDYLRLVRRGILPVPDAPAEAYPQPAVA